MAENFLDQTAGKFTSERAKGSAKTKAKPFFLFLAEKALHSWLRKPFLG
ncbi:hypothetical protein OAE79_00875 [Rhodopirellula sp.]|nr:hypothetical protein [Rhodopirellula sp.]